MKKNFFIIAALIFLSCSSKKQGNPHVIIQTKQGDIEVELFPKQSPKTVAAYLSYVDSGFYEKTCFYRILSDENQPSNAAKAELIQGGLWKTKYQKAETLAGIPHESTQQTGIKHTNGTISLARDKPGTANSEFFICVGDQPGFDFGGDNNPDKLGYAAFGRVVKGMNVVRMIYNQPEDNQSFTPPVPIYNIVRK
ncbi:MAG: peptidylprolyl isomerase [Chitinophagaceae bacterium]|jgi:peptidyl-prolyl cis-trans isomerase A (cyclophilin A)|nr:peptidylprolyl isomerase [Chitinophagaceae bacterium]